MNEVALLCAGAAKGLVARIAPEFTSETGVAIDGTFGAVGALVEKLEGGAPCDVLVLTASLVARLDSEGRVVAGSAMPLGRVATSIAVPTGAPRPPIGDAEALRATLAAAAGLHYPDPERATAGIHFAAVLRKLGLEREVASRCRTYDNGAAAMAALARAGRGDVGCTQATEILYTPGVDLVGALPHGFELVTVYSVAVNAQTRAPDAAQRLAAMLAAPAARAVRRACGFDDAEPRTS